MPSKGYGIMRVCVPEEQRKARRKKGQARKHSLDGAAEARAPAFRSRFSNRHFESPFLCVEMSTLYHIRRQGKTRDEKFRVSGFGLRVEGFGFLVSSFGFRVEG